MTNPMTPEAAIELIDASWNAWIAAIGAVPEERWSEAGVCGVWSIKDLLGHLAVWDDLTIQYLKLVASGVEIDAIDYDALNDKEAALRADRTIEEQRAEMLTAHAEMLAYLPVAVGIDLTGIGGNTWEHYPEHTAQVVAWGEMI